MQNIFKNLKPKAINYEHQQKIFTPAAMGALLRNRRKELGYTQVQIALLMDCSPRLIGELERGRGTVAFETVLEYATGLGIDLIGKVRG